MYVTEVTQYCVTAGSTLIFKSVQSRELGQWQNCYIFVRFLVQIKTFKFAFEINWPLVVVFSNAKLDNNSGSPNKVLFSQIWTVTLFLAANQMANQLNNRGWYCTLYVLEKLTFFRNNIIRKHRNIRSIHWTN